MSRSPFDFVNAITLTKKNIMAEPEAEKDYVPFVVNRALSYFPDTVIYANEMNKAPFSSNRMQFDFLLHAIRKKKRFSKWAKREEPKDAAVVAEYYGYSMNKAEEVLSLHSKEQIAHMKWVLSKGGKKR